MKKILLLFISIAFTGCTAFYLNHGILIVETDDYSKISLDGFIESEQVWLEQGDAFLDLKSAYKAGAKLEDKGYITSSYAVMTAGLFPNSAKYKIDEAFKAEELKLTFDQGVSVRAYFVYGENSSSLSDLVYSIKSSLDDGSKTPKVIIDELLDLVSEEDKAKFYAESDGSQSSLTLKYK